MVGSATYTVTYEYEDAVWKDRLTAYNDNEITYDTIGNPVTWHNNADLTWENGRQLVGYTKGSKAYTYTYNDEGIRTSKTVNGVTTTYTVVDGVLRRMTIGDNVLQFFENSVLYNGTEYWYVYNAQNDVVGLIDNTGAYVVEYTYNAWGRLLSTTGTLAETLGKDNPFRYRGYIYDEETGLYYVSSRYYDPVIGRWLNADSTNAITDYNTIYSNHYNLFAYCINNPVMYTDPTGHMIPLLIPAILTVVEVAVYATAAVIGVGLLAQMAVDGNLALELPRVSSAEIIPFPTPEPEPEIFVMPSPTPVQENDKNESDEYSIWFAYLVSGKIEIGQGVSLDTALSYLLAGIDQNFMCANYQVALQLSGVWGRQRHYEIDKGKENVPGYYYHFHINKKTHGAPHIWHYGPKGDWVNL